MTVKIVTTPENRQHTVFIYTLATHQHTQLRSISPRVNTASVRVKMMIIFHTVKLAAFGSRVCACGLAIKILSQCISLFSFSVEIRLDAQSTTECCLSASFMQLVSLSLFHLL